MGDTDRITRKCDKCGVVDAHAHHVHYVALVHPVTGEALDVSVSKHVQCCAEDGCAICATDLEFAVDKAIGDAFTAQMDAKTPEHLSALAQRHGISTPGGE